MRTLNHPAPEVARRSLSSRLALLARLFSRSRCSPLLFAARPSAYARDLATSTSTSTSTRSSAMLDAFVSLALLIASMSSSSVPVRVVFGRRSSRFSRRSRFLDRPSRPRAPRRRTPSGHPSRARRRRRLERQRECRGSRFGEFFLRKFVRLSAASRLLASAWRTIMDGPRSSFGFPSRVNTRARDADVWGARCPRPVPVDSRAARVGGVVRARSRRRVYGYYELRCDETRI